MVRALARQVKEQQSTRTITQLKSGTGDITSSSAEILEVITQFYSDLYASTNPTESDITAYLKNNIPTMTLTAEHQDFLDQDITEREILSVIAWLHSRKAPGEDGFASEFYKEYQHLLVPKFVLLCNQILKDGDLPCSWRQSSTITILKPNQDPLLLSSYLPISLINQNAKIFTAVLANRVKQIV